jgi:predicted O-methyltransferase YrrM
MEQLDWDLGKLLKTSSSYWQGCTLQTAVKLDLFSHIADQQLSSPEIAAKIKADGRGVETLLNALVAMNLMQKVEERYANTQFGATYLSQDSPQYMGYIISHHRNLLESWSRLDEAVMTGKPTRSRTSYAEEEARKSFLMGMFNQASNNAPRILPVIDLTDRQNLLDLGGGPGTYAIHFCQNYPQLKATVYDLPTTRPFAEEMIGKFDMSERVNFVEGNYLEDDLSGKYDVIWMSHILHAEGPESCQRLIQKAIERLDPGGMIIIHEFILNDSMDGPLFPALFSLNMLIGTEGGQSYSEDQLKQMLMKAGAKEIRRIAYQNPNDAGLMVGVI